MAERGVYVWQVAVWQSGSVAIFRMMLFAPPDPDHFRSWIHSVSILSTSGAIVSSITPYSLR